MKFGVKGDGVPLIDITYGTGAPDLKLGTSKLEWMMFAPSGSRWVGKKNTERRDEPDILAWDLETAVLIADGDLTSTGKNHSGRDHK